ncbi:MAG: hypothetical protein KDA80_12660 [Planctomycetaceae bacterium]|nr:hypothetical protein [Planctomycetaceae bacterium]
MTLKELIPISVEELKIKTEGHKAWGFGSFDNWNLNQDDGQLIFSNDDGTRAVAPAQIIGSYDYDNGTWKWAWANETIQDHLKEHSNIVRQWGEDNGAGLLTNDEIYAEESDAWDFVAIAVKLCDAQCAYRGPVNDRTAIFMTFGSPQISRATS